MARRTAFESAFGWVSLDHIILGSGLYDSRGISYVDNSFQIASKGNSEAAFLFAANGTPLRWRVKQTGARYFRHEVGGFSDHLPICARFTVLADQGAGRIPLSKPGQPDPGDLVIP